MRKAQKHMQRATQLLNRTQFGFGVGDDDKRGSHPRFKFEKDLISKIREHVAKGEYKALQDMIDIGEHSSHYKEYAMAEMAEWKREELEKHTGWLDHEAKERLQEMMDEQFREILFFLFLERAKHRVSIEIKKQLRQETRNLLKSTAPESVGKLEQMILAHGIFKSAAIDSISENTERNENAERIHKSDLRTKRLWRKKLALLNHSVYWKQRNDEANRRRRARRYKRTFTSLAELSGDETESDNELTDTESDMFIF